VQTNSTLGNTPGVDEIKPQVLGMKGAKGAKVDFVVIRVREKPGTSKSKNKKRVDLFKNLWDTGIELILTGPRIEDVEKEEEPINFDIGEGQDHKMLNYNKNLRGKLESGDSGASSKSSESSSARDRDTSGDLLRLKKKQLCQKPNRLPR
jgi:hypothetical protein